MPEQHASISSDPDLDPEQMLALLRRMALTESDCYGCVDWYHFEPRPPDPPETTQ